MIGIPWKSQVTGLINYIFYTIVNYKEYCSSDAVRLGVDCVHGMLHTAETHFWRIPTPKPYSTCLVPSSMQRQWWQGHRNCLSPPSMQRQWWQGHRNCLSPPSMQRQWWQGHRNCLSPPSMQCQWWQGHCNCLSPPSMQCQWWQGHQTSKSH